MEGNSGLPPEIMVLCTTVETKEHAVRLLEWIQSIPDIPSGLARDPAIPAVCSLIASEQLGNTVVTERRAQQWSQSTPGHFRTIMNDVQKLMAAFRAQNQSRRRLLTLRVLVDEFCPENTLPRMREVETHFWTSPGSETWKFDSEYVQFAIFSWTCRSFKIPTAKPIENIQRDCDIPATVLRDIEAQLDRYCFAMRPQNPAESSSSRLTLVPSTSPVVTPSEEKVTSTYPLRLEELAREFAVGEDAMGGMRFLEKTIREKDELKNLVDWDSTMGRCVIFYWTCSVLKIPSAKHITLRTQYNLAKRDFDKVLSALDLHRADLRKKLEVFYAGNPALQLLPQSTQWPATSPANLKPQAPTPPSLVLGKSISPSRRNTKKGTGKRGRPPKPKSPPPISTEPTSTQEEHLFPLCKGPALQRALVLLRSFNARRLPASDADRVPPKSLPALVALLTSQQFVKLGDGQVDEMTARQASCLSLEEFGDTLTTVRVCLNNLQALEEFGQQAAFDSLALEHGLSIDAIMSMLHVRESLKGSRCLSTGMDWDSPLVICSVFFWTCAILKVPDVKQSLLRSRSLASKREFDSMMQLLNSHCSAIRHRLEDDSASGAFWFAPPPSGVPRTPGPRHPSFYGEQELYLADLDEVSSKRVKRETVTPSEYDFDPSESPRQRASRKAGRPPMSRKPLKQDDGPGSASMAASDEQASIYRPITQFPPASWIPPETLSNPQVENGTYSECPSSESGELKRHNTRYKTLDYQHAAHDRFEAWKPDGDEVLKQFAAYQHWVERMKLLYGPHWEQDIIRVDKGIPFE